VEDDDPPGVKDEDPSSDDEDDDEEEGVEIPGVEDIDETEPEEGTPAAFRGHQLRSRDRKANYDHMHKFAFAQESEEDDLLVTFHEPMDELFTTEQMSLNRGLKEFGEDRANAVVEELKQLDRDAIKPIYQANSRTQRNKRATKGGAPILDVPETKAMWSCQSKRMCRR
jgi:hypothetical protein